MVTFFALERGRPRPQHYSPIQPAAGPFDEYDLAPSDRVAKVAIPDAGGSNSWRKKELAELIEI